MSDSGESSGSATITPPGTPVPRYEKKAKGFDNIATKEFSRMIYASNTLENTGLSLEDTTRLCELIFRDEKVPETYHEEKLLEEQRQKEEEEAQWRVIKWIISAQEYLSRTVGSDNGAELTVEVDERREDRQARREVIQHARAWKYLLERFCIGEEELSVNLIKNTHTVLCAGAENSKLARLLMNGVLWRYCGIVIPLGEGKKEKDEYLEILRRGTEIFHREEFSVPVEEQKGYEELALVVRKKAAEAKKRIEESMRWKWRWM
ncbi:hypothetical protein TWF191_009505 [Orbilia oligospora]|uniref:Uncharacterized protein n=1 Tax=Orbilia oligospora TaxID=2813651 RepID=A0A7C8VFC0_ORBOL|nr:hypothetical protein TWF191_009505 [Orbilia oligospora]